MASITVTFNPIGREVKVTRRISILDAAIEVGVPLRAECGGNGICGKCKVIIHEKNAAHGIRDAERKHLSPRELVSGYRLACQTIPKRDIDILIPRETMIEERKILVDGIAKRTTLDPAVRKLHLKLNKPSLSDITPDFQRLQQTLSDSRKLQDQWDREGYEWEPSEWRGAPIEGWNCCPEDNLRSQDRILRVPCGTGQVRGSSHDTGAYPERVERSCCS